MALVRSARTDPGCRDPPEKRWARAGAPNSDAKFRSPAASRSLARFAPGARSSAGSAVSLRRSWAPLGAGCRPRCPQLPPRLAAAELYSALPAPAPAPPPPPTLPPSRLRPPLPGSASFSSDSSVGPPRSLLPSGSGPFSSPDTRFPAAFSTSPSSPRPLSDATAPSRLPAALLTLVPQLHPTPLARSALQSRSSSYLGTGLQPLRLPPSSCLVGKRNS